MMAKLGKRQALNEKIRALCEAKRWKFKPWQVHPADVDDGPSPFGPGTGGTFSWPKAQRLRRELIVELERRP